MAIPSLFAVEYRAQEQVVDVMNEVDVECQQCEKLRNDKNDVECSLKQKIQIQAEEISKLKDELNNLKRSPVVKFISNAHSPKVRSKFY